MGFLLVFQHCINKQRKILRRQSRQLEGYFGPFKGKSDDLVGRIASVVQSAFSFHRSKLLERLCFAFSGAGEEFCAVCLCSAERPKENPWQDKACPNAS